MFRSALLILSGNASTSILLFARNLLVARLVSVEDYGIAATFAISMAIVEMMSTLGLQSLIVQDREGDDPALQAGLQGFHLLRSVISGAVLFFISHPIANLLGIPEVAWAYQVLAVVPVLRGFIHFDIYRMHRSMVFLPSVISTSGPALLAVLIIWPLYQVLGDYRVMLYSVVVQGFALMIVSHLTATRTYRLALDGTIVRRALLFGWPLLINNILLLAIFQGEKLIVGSELGLESLAIFAMGMTLTLTPTLLFSKSLQSFMLPQLSAVKESPKEFRHLARVSLEASLCFSLVLVLGFVLLGAPVVNILLGDKYSNLIPFLTWLAILQALRGFKTGASVVAVSQAKTENAMISNAIRAALLIPAWYLATRGYSLEVIVWLAIVGEFLGYLASMVLLRYRIGLPLRKSIVSAMCAIAVLFVVAVFSWQPFGDGQSSSVISAIALLLFSTASFMTMRDLHRYVREHFLKKVLG
ncbi:Membrane protein involved in the export of O-antigen and teichoic acid [Aliiroseovarius sediminilitoris]|uniref:Membrane protein involved in the export of O-antigen and teichoic acid n=1 Tax=Aliiroseovarius sediminilitoris TaxID=1173584 RepID=A0A1I0RBV8_9RHOB|nr:oligosaccharide flippase family protein [Aliiroseovarius sediminilitoris]SEW38318.1 Membrane protein involved in the export of O-antigen and teichoic acid [Aliiroseovarius sediminilitoris]